MDESTDLRPVYILPHPFPQRGTPVRELGLGFEKMQLLAFKD